MFFLPLSLYFRSHSARDGWPSWGGMSLGQVRMETEMGGVCCGSLLCMCRVKRRRTGKVPPDLSPTEKPAPGFGP